MPVAIEAGPELDRAVAEAVGFKCSAGGEDDGVLIDSVQAGVPDAAAVLFHPSEDLNAGFAAAERVGLFSKHAGMLYFSSHIPKWYVSNTVYIDDPLGQGDTPALAICAAILKLTSILTDGRF